MLHTFSTRGDRRHRYYTCSRAHNEGATTCPGARVAAGEFERFIVQQIQHMGTDPVLVAKTAACVATFEADRLQDLADERRRLGPQRRTDQGGDAGNTTIDPTKLRTALAGFQPIWDQLFPREQERILRLLIEHITYHPDGGNVEIELRACGVDALAAEARP